MHTNREDEGLGEKKSFFRKYFLEGQQLDDSAKQQIPDDADCIHRFMIQNRKYIAFLFPVLIMQVRIERRAVFFGTIGSIPGLIIGFEFFDPLLDAAQKKMLFVSIWTSFAIALFILNSQKKRTTFNAIAHFKPWKAAVLIVTGFVGGIFTAFAGSGVDICVFSIVTLLFRISEKTATPTTVVLMGLNSVVGAYYRLIWIGDVPKLALDYIKVSIPVGVTLAPCGSFLGSHFHRQVLASLIYALESISVFAFLLTRPAVSLVVIGIVIVFAGFVFFSVISLMGQRLLKNDETDKEMRIAAKALPRTGAVAGDVKAHISTIHSPVVQADP